MVGGASLLFCVLFCWKLESLGMTIDEATHGVWASAVLEHLKALFAGSPAPDFPYSWLLSFFSVGNGFEFPLMIRYFTGTYPIYFLVPFIAVFGKNAFAIRIGFLLCALVFAFSFRFCARVLWGRKIADVGFVLLVLNPVFLRSYRLGIEREEALLLPLFWLGLAFVAAAGNMRMRFVKFFLCGFCWGVGLWAKLMSVAFIAAVCCFGACNFTDFKGFAKKTGLKSLQGIVSFGAGICLGGAGLLWYNIRDPFASVKGALVSLVSKDTSFGAQAADSSQFFQNAWLRLKQFWAFSLNIIDLDGIGPGWGVCAVFFMVFGLLCVGLLVYGVVLRKVKNRGLVCGVFAATGVYLLLSCFSPTRIEAGHMVGLLWLFPLVQAIAVFQMMPKQKIGYAFVAVSVLCGLFMSFAMLGNADSNKATGLFFSGSHSFRQYLRQNRTLPLVFCSSEYLGLNLTFGINELLFEDTGLNNGDNFNANRMYFLFERGQGRKDTNQGDLLFDVLMADSSLRVEKVEEFTNETDDYHWELYVATKKGKQTSRRLAQIMLTPGNISGVSAYSRPFGELRSFLGADDNNRE